MTHPAASIVIPTYNRGALLRDTVEMALAQDYFDFEVIVVDQTAVAFPGAQTMVDASGGRLKYIRREEPNLPAARNAGVIAARGDIIVFVDDDVVLGREYIAAHVRHYDDPSIGAVMGLTLHPWDGSEGLAVEGTRRLFGDRGMLPDGTCLVQSVVGCNSSFRRQAILDAGMSDERFTGSARGEDTDLSMRVARLGYKLVFDPRVRLLHLAVGTGGCENRDAGADERLRDERCRLYLLLLLKNWAAFGSGHVAAAIWSTYRNYALNRFTVASPVRCLTQHRKFFAHLSRARRDAAMPSMAASCRLC